MTTGTQEQKQRNLESNPQVAITTGSTGANGWDSGKDIVVEGTAVRVTNAEPLQAPADAWFAKYGEDWKFEVRGHEFVELSDSGGSTTGSARVYRVAAALGLSLRDGGRPGDGARLRGGSKGTLCSVQRMIAEPRRRSTS